MHRQDHSDRPRPHLLKNSFLHLPGISVDDEEDLWSAGVRDWDDAIASNELSTEQIDSLGHSVEALAARNAVYFGEQYKAGERWRLLPDFQNETAFLDIETTGLGGEAYITMCGILDASGFKAYVRGDNLDELVSDLEKYKIVVTFNGISFDVPWIRRELGPTLENAAHVDLRYVLKNVGLKGGLKKIERAIGMDRGDDLSLLSGRDAVVLWNMAQEGEPNAMETLIRYNAEDVASLPRLAEYAYGQNTAGTPMAVPGFFSPARFDTTTLAYDSALVQYLCG
ncbi:MAG TPA: exonuclease [Dehalococcoidia bacterium]|nr:exonuclease [Dehalococcoidia bacterium]